MFGLTKKELAILKKLSSPIKIQNFLDTIPANYEKKGETYMSPRRTLREKKAHCLEGALIAAAALLLQGEKPLLMDLKTVPPDTDHVVALYKRNGFWGAISKTNHATIRFRDPIYKTLRELALSYFHEYFDNKSGKKTLRSYSVPLDLTIFGENWITSEENLDEIAVKLDTINHFELIPSKNKKLIRKADKMERKAGSLLEWKRSDKRT